MKTIKIFTYAFLAIFLTLASCSGEDGEDGMDGINGEQGIPGEDGEDGNANVIASPWLPVEFSTTASTFTFFDIEDPRITQEVADGAAIYAYGRSSAVGSIPFVFSNRSYYFAVFPDINQFRFIATSVDGATPFIFNDISEVRYVIIPSSETSGRSMDDRATALKATLKEKGIDVNNYDEVAAYYNLN